MAEHKKDFKELIYPVYKYLNESPSRVAFSDWYDTKTSKALNFKNRTVQGGLFMPLLAEKFKLK